MILRRVIAHFKKQEWTAIALDFLIVVVGVFIGIQVANWNAEREERALEAVYMERLHQEIVDLTAIRTIRLKQREQASRDLRNAMTKLTTPKGDALTKAECYWLADNPPTSNPTDELPLVIELLSSGRLTIFTNRELETALGNFLIVRSRARDSRNGIVNDMQNVDRDYSAFFSIRGALSPLADLAIVGIDNFFQAASVSCDEKAIRESQAFLNDLARLELDYSYYVGDNIRVSAALEELHAVLDEIRGHRHPQVN